MTGSAGGFSKGDVVSLKCGGCSMIVAEINGGRAECVWHDNDGAPRTASYEFVLLEKVGAPPGASGKVGFA